MHRRLPCRLVRMPKKDEDLLARFGNRVRQLRSDRNLSQEAFAAACGLDRAYMGGIERGQRNITLRKIERIAATLKISLSELLDRV